MVEALGAKVVAVPSELVVVASVVGDDGTLPKVVAVMVACVSGRAPDTELHIW